MNISRHHARIVYDFQRRRFVLESSWLKLKKSSLHRFSNQSTQKYNSRSSRTTSLLSKLNLQSILFEPRHEPKYPLQSFSTIPHGGTILVHAKDIGKLSLELETAIEEHRYSDVWNLHDHHMSIDGFPRKYIVNRLIGVLAESRDTIWLEKAYGLVEKAFSESKQNLFDKDTLIYLSFSLARCALPVPASTVLRKLVDMELFPPVNAWSAILGYMSKTGPGAFLAAELVLEIGFLFQDGRVDPRKKINAPLIAMKPNTTAFNIALAGCLLFDTTRKAELLLEMMPRIGVKADVTLLIIMAHIYERNGRREELKKLKRYIDEANSISDAQFREFYNCLLTCHLNFGDLESASHMVLDMLRKAKEARNSLAAANLAFEAAESRTVLTDKKLEELDNRGLHLSHSISFEDFSRDRNFSSLEPIGKDLLCFLLMKLHGQNKLITSERGILQPTEGIYVKLVRAFLEADKTKELAEFLIKAERENSPASVDDSALAHVINSCISLGWLDQAHDLLDEMRLAGVKTGSSLYASLLKAYSKGNRFGEMSSLLRDARKAGVQLDSSSYDALIKTRVLQKDTKGALDLFKEMKEAKLPRTGHQNFEILVKGCEENGESGMMTKLLHEIKEGQRVDYGVHDWNSVIHFFSKKRLMQDAEKALKKMRSLGHIPNAQTFHSMVTGYAAIGGKYTEVTELWGEMKSLSYSSPMKFDQELLDSVLYTFVRGGFFFRANEVVEMMEKGNMFIDKYKYRTLFLKYHKTMCKGKAPKVQTEAQIKKRESALTFKKWVSKMRGIYISETEIPCRIFCSCKRLHLLLQYDVLFSDNFTKSIDRIKSTDARKEVFSLLKRLSSGWRRHGKDMSLYMTGNCSELLEVYKLNGSLNLVWSVDILREDSKESQVIKVWDILPLHKIIALAKFLNNVFKSYKSETLDRCKRKRLESGYVVPMSWPTSSKGLSDHFSDDDDYVKHLQIKLASLNLLNEPGSSINRLILFEVTRIGKPGYTFWLSCFCDRNYREAWWMCDVSPKFWVLL